MPGPVAHLVLALQILNGPCINKNKEKFLIGTSFPDIRYITTIAREKTHSPNVTLSQIVQESSDFQSGMDFHSLVDKTHTYYLHKNNILNMLPEHPKASLCLKFFEGMLLKTRMPNWKSIKKIFDQTLPEEKNLGIPKRTIKEWHVFIQLFCQDNPPKVKKLAVTYLLTKFQNKFFKLPSFIRKILATALHNLPLPFLSKTEHFFKTISKNKPLKQKIFYFYDNFPQILKIYEQQQLKTGALAPDKTFSATTI